MSNNAESLSEYFGKMITSKFNQHAMVRIVGRAGMGKSYAGIALGIGVAEVVAREKGGKAEDYFSFERDLAIMGTEEIQRVLGDPGKFHIIMLDDVGVGVGARDFQKNSNKDLSKIIQTFRPNNNLVIETLQAGFLVDKIFRLLAHYEIEIEQSNFEYGYVIAKCQEIVYKHKTDEIHYPYIFEDGCKYIRHIFQTPPKEWTEKYEKERSIQLKRISEKQMKEMQERDINHEIPLKEKAIKLHTDWKNGLLGNMTFREVCEAHGINYESAKVTISKILAK